MTYFLISHINIKYLNTAKINNFFNIKRENINSEIKCNDTRGVGDRKKNENRY